MKIVFVSSGTLYSEENPFERGGAQSQIYGISREMVKKGHEVYVTGRFSNFNGEEYRIIDGINFVNIKTPDIKDQIAFGVVSSLLYSKSVAEKIKQLNPDIISLNERFSAYFPSKVDIPKTFTTHNPDAMEFFKDFAIENNKLNTLFFYFKRKVEEVVFSRTDAIVPLNEDIENYLHEKGFFNTFFIPNAVDSTKYTNKYDENFILFAGRLDKVKGISYLIQAFSEVCMKYDTKLLIIGSGSQEIELKNKVISEDIGEKVEFIPMVDKSELSDYLSRCSIFVLPSLFECMPVTLLEAMASGKPVIASCIPGPKDVITHEYDGFLFEKENVEDLKNYLELCLQNENLRNLIGNNARKAVEDKFVFNKVASKYIDVFKVYN